MTYKEKLFMACDRAESVSRAEFGPFRTAKDAEKQAEMLGWRYIMCYTHTVDAATDEVLEVVFRCYEIGGPAADNDRPMNPCLDINMVAVGSRRDPAANFPAVAPMTGEQQKFFELYEEQMKEPRGNLFRRDDFVKALLGSITYQLKDKL